MINITVNEKEKLVDVTAKGKLNEEDYKEFVPLLERKIDELGKIKLYFEVRDFDGWTIEAMWSDFKFDVKHRDDLEKVAIVGNKKWHEWMTDMMKPFTSAEVKYFPLEQNAEAKEWINN